MFADPLSNLMLVMLMFFAGLVVMFVFIMRHLDLVEQNTEEIRRQLTVSMMDMERGISRIQAATQNGETSSCDMTQVPLPSPLPPEPAKAGGALAQMEDLVDLFDPADPKDGRA